MPVPSPRASSAPNLTSGCRHGFLVCHVSPGSSEAVNQSLDRARWSRCEPGQEEARRRSSAYGKGFRQSPAKHIGRRGDGRGLIHSLLARADARNPTLPNPVGDDVAPSVTSGPDQGRPATRRVSKGVEVRARVQNPSRPTTDSSASPPPTRPQVPREPRALRFAHRPGPMHPPRRLRGPRLPGAPPVDG